MSAISTLQELRLDLPIGHQELPGVIRAIEVLRVVEKDAETETGDEIYDAFAEIANVLAEYNQAPATYKAHATITRISEIVDKVVDGS